MKILVNTNYYRETFAGLPPELEVEFAVGKPAYSVREMEEKIQPYNILVIPSIFPVSNRLLDRATNLKLICNCGAGYNNVDIAYARSKGILVCNTPDAVTQSTAELTLALMLSLMRRVAETNMRIRTERESLWRYDQLTSHSLSGKCLGIVGMGKIGRRVAEMSRVFNMSVVYYNPRTQVPGYERLDLETLLGRADVVSLHMPLNESTYHMIGRRELALMKPESVLINVARGPVVDEPALVEALQQGRLSGAGLDVYEAEPHVSPELYRMNQVVLTPHIGGNTAESLYAMMRDSAQNVLAFFKGQCRNIVD